MGIILGAWLSLSSWQSSAQQQHQLGAICNTCHGDLFLGGTVFADSNGTRGVSGLAVTLIGENGKETPLGATNSSGNIAAISLTAGRYLIRLGEITSRTWHVLPAQGMCNACHVRGGNLSTARTKKLPNLHTRIPVDNNCAHCHHFPASMSFAALATSGVLAAAPAPPAPPASQVDILGRIYPFDPAAHRMVSVRQDIFMPGYYSMFDVILAVAAANGIAVEYHYDEARKTHFIDKINGVAADYWYHFSFDAGTGNTQEINFRRANRWDELLWRPGVWIRVIRGEDLEEIKQEYLEEIQRENSLGHVIPNVQISANATLYRNNPLGSGRIRGVQKQLRDVRVAAHNTRSAGYPSPYAKPFQPGVVTAFDVLLSLKDQGQLDLVSAVHYSYFAQHYIDSQYVVAIGFPGVGTAHASGTQGWIYVAENGTPNRLPNNAAGTLHITSDILVIHAPDFATWQWRDSIGPGLPYYESAEPAGSLPGENDQLCFPLPENNSQLLSGIAVVHEGATAAAVNWIAHTASGSLASVDAPGVNPGRTVIPSRGQISRLIPELFGGSPKADGGWLEVLGDEPGMRGFFMIFDPSLAVLDGAALSGRRRSQVLIPELPDGQAMNLTVINTSRAQTAEINLQLRDNQGNQMESPIVRNIPALARVSISVQDVFQIPSGYLTALSTVPVLVITQFGIPGVHASVLNALDLNGGARRLFAPQFVQGAGFKSVLSIVNLENAITHLVLTWLDSDGRQIGSPLHADLPGLGRITVSDSEAFSAAAEPQGLQGYLLVNSSATRIAGIVRFSDPGESMFQTVLPLVTEGSIDSLFGQVANDPVNWFTGLAVVNPNALPASLTIEVFTPDASATWRKELSIPAGSRISALLSELVPDLPSMQRGYFKVRANRPVVSFAVFGPRSLSSLAAIPPLDLN